MATETRTEELLEKYDVGDGSLLTKLRANWTGYLFVLPIILAFLFMYYIPMLRGIQLTFFDVSVGGPDTFVGLENYTWMVTNDLFVYALGWSIIFAFGTLILQILIGLTAALLLNELGSGIREWMSALIMSPYFAAAVAGGVMMRWFLSPDFGMIAYFLVHIGQQPIAFLSQQYLVHISLIVAQGWHDFAYAGIIYLAAVQSVPREQYEAAALGGAGRFRRFRDVTLPYLITPTIIILATRTAWNLAEFAQPFEMTQGGPGTTTTLLSILTYNVAYIQGSLGRAYTIGVVMTLISLTAAVLYIGVIRSEQELYI